MDGESASWASLVVWAAIRQRNRALATVLQFTGPGLATPSASSPPVGPPAEPPVGPDGAHATEEVVGGKSAIFDGMDSSERGHPRPGSDPAPIHTATLVQRLCLVDPLPVGLRLTSRAGVDAVLPPDWSLAPGSHHSQPSAREASPRNDWAFRHANSMLWTAGGISWPAPENSWSNRRLVAEPTDSSRDGRRCASPRRCPTSTGR